MLITVPFWSTKISPSHLLVYYPYLIKVSPPTALPTHSVPPSTPMPLIVCINMKIYLGSHLSTTRLLLDHFEKLIITLG